MSSAAETSATPQSTSEGASERRRATKSWNYAARTDPGWFREDVLHRGEFIKSRINGLKVDPGERGHPYAASARA